MVRKVVIILMIAISALSLAIGTVKVLALFIDIFFDEESTSIMIFLFTILYVQGLVKALKS